MKSPQARSVSAGMVRTRVVDYRLMREESSVSFLDSLPGPLQRGPGRESKNTSVDLLAHQSIMPAPCDPARLRLGL